MSGLEKRLQALERASGNEHCPWCAGVFIITVNGEPTTATRHGRPMAAADLAEFERAGDGCPECKTGLLTIRVPSEIPRP